MAKCIGFTCDWTPKVTETRTEKDLNYLVENASKDEEILCKKLEDVTSLVLDIANDFILLKQTIEPNGLKLNCNEVRDYLMTELKKLNLDTYQTTNDICNSKLSSFAKQKYFILYSSGVITQLQQLLQVTGRLSELEQKIYLEEQQKHFISDESTIIHALTSIWLASLNIMNNFLAPGRAIFGEADAELDDYGFSDQLEFSTSCNHYSKVFTMDLLITSWIQFNRIFFTTLRSFEESERSKILSELLPLIIDYQSKPSLMTESTRQPNIVPLEPCYSLCDQQTLAYFVVWNIYALSRIAKPIDKPIITNCNEILGSSYCLAMKQFEAIIEQPDYKLSPHQEERHKLLTHMKLSLDKLDIVIESAF